MVVINALGFALSIALHFLGPKRRIRMSLSSKFQSNEHSVSSNLLLLISTTQFITFLLSEIAILYIRIYQSTNLLSPAFKENADLFIYYTLALPLISTVYLSKVKRQRIMDIKSSVNIKAIGNDGWMNYYSVLQKQWM
ncbi:hypothetical protein OSTOST_01486 [Ostertagia ostertagi]